MVVGDFIDHANVVSHLYDDSFVRFLDDFRHVANGIGVGHMFPGTGFMPYQESFERALTETAFIKLDASTAPLAAVFDPIDPYFTHFIPLVNSNGQKLINPVVGFGGGSTWAAVCIPSAGNSSLAWEFTLQLTSTILDTSSQGCMLQLAMHNSVVIPITRAHFRPRIETVLNRIANPTHIMGRDLIPLAGIHDDGDSDQAIETAIARLEALNESPAAIFETRLPPQFYAEDGILDLFLLGITTAEDTARELHNMVSLWLLE